MPSGPYTYDFFISRRGTAAEVAQEVAGVLTEAGHRVCLQDWDIDVADNFVAKIHEMLERCRDLIAILSRDYLESPYTKLEWTSFLAATAKSNGDRRLIPLRVEDVEPTGLFAATVYADLVGVVDRVKRRTIILKAASLRSRVAAPVPPMVQGIPPRNPGFIGRGKLLDQLHRALTGIASNGSATNQAAIFGLGGIGKSSLAAEYAHRHLDEYAGVWWVSADSRAVLIESLAELGARLEARELGAEHRDAGEQRTADEMARTALVKLSASATPWLLIYDNVRNSRDIRDLVPSTGARILITTRLATWHRGAVPLEVDELPRADAVELLLTVAERSDQAGAARLADALGCLPLALDHAAAYVKLTGMSFDEYATRAAELIARAPKDYPESVFATFNLAIEQATADCADAEMLLAFLSVLAPEHIQRDLIDETILDRDARDNALMALRSVCLVKFESDPDGDQAIVVHRAVRHAMALRLKSKKKSGKTIRTAIARLARAFPDKGYSDPGCWSRCKQLLPHALALRDEAANTRVETAQLAALLDGAANYLLGRASFSEAEPLFREAVAIAQRKLGLEHELVGQYLNNLGNLYLNNGRFAEAEPHYRRAISIGFKTIGRDNPRVATRLNNLAMVWQRQRRYGRAEAYFRIAIKICEKEYGRKHFTVASRLHKLAGLFAETKRYADAEPLYREAITIGEATVGRDNFQVRNWANDFANLLRDTGRFAEAERIYRDGLSHFLAAVGPINLNVAFTRENLSELLLLTRRLEEALREASEATAVHEQLCDAKHRWTKGAAEVLVKVLIALGRSEEADQRRLRHGLDHPAAQTN
jgi:tetratricopeptide (TPR) repeat protein